MKVKTIFILFFVKCQGNNFQCYCLQCIDVKSFFENMLNVCFELRYLENIMSRLNEQQKKKKKRKKKQLYFVNT